MTVDTSLPHNQAVPGSFRQALPWVVFVSLLFFLNYAARCALSPVFVYLEADLGIGHAQATSLLLVQGIGMSISLGLVGFLMSRVLPRNMAACSLFMSGLALLCAPLLVSLDTGRILFFFFGLGAGLYFPAGMTILGGLVSHHDWGKAVGIHELAANLGFIIFPVLAPVLLWLMPWRGVLMSWGGLMCIVAVLFYKYGRGGWEYAAKTSLAGSLELLRQPSLWGFMFLMVMALVGEYAIFSILQLYLVSSFPLAPDEASYMMALSRVCSPILVVLGGWAADRFAVRPFLAGSFALHAVALGLMGQADFHLAMVGMFLQAASIALPYPGLFKLLGECYPGKLQPVVLSLVMPASGLFATGLTPSLLGLAGETVGFGPGLWVIGALSLCCVPIILGVKRFRPRD